MRVEKVAEIHGFNIMLLRCGTRQTAGILILSSKELKVGTKDRGDQARNIKYILNYVISSVKP